MAFKRTSKTNFVAPPYPRYWPKWTKECDFVRSHGDKAGLKCLNRARNGDTRCRFHGSNGKRALMAHRRYLIWVATGATASYDDVNAFTTRALARYFLKPEEHHGVHMSTEDKVIAATFLMTSAATLEPRKEAIEVIGPMVGDDYELAARIAQALSEHGMLPHAW